VPSDFQFGKDNKTPEFLAKFPFGKVPAFESADGKFCFAEAQAIARYLAEIGPKAGQLLGEDPQTRAIIEQWCCFAEQEMGAYTSPPLVMVLFKVQPFEEAWYNRSMDNFARALKRLDVAVKGKKFLVGDQLTLADIMVLGPLQLAGRFMMDAEMRKEAPNVEGYMKGLLEIPELRQAFGEPQLCEKRMTV
jgi:elongation factor 1-gamma